MKQLSLIASLGIFCFSAAYAGEKMEFDCDSGNGHIYLTVPKTDAAGIDVILADKAGVREASGSLACEGPRLKAYFCDGTVTLANANPGDEPVNLSLTLQQSIFQGDAGSVDTNGDEFYCRPR
ncbi:MAG: hypothetical protein ACXVCI_00995 [Bdellovibrionota bacterium]